MSGDVAHWPVKQPVHRTIRSPFCRDAVFQCRCPPENPKPYLSKLSASADTAIAHRYALSFSFDGYLRDEREFYAIPEIRTYFANLAAAWPYWAWFINPKAGMPFLPLVMMLLTPGEATVSKGCPAWKTCQKSIALGAYDLLSGIDELDKILGLPSSLVRETKDDFAAFCHDTYQFQVEDAACPAL